MTPKAWRTLLLSLCAVLFACAVYETWAFTTIMGVSGAAITRPHDLTYRIDAPKGSAAYTAGLRTGDLINAAAMSPQARLRFTSGVWAVGERVPLTAQRGPRTVHVVLIPQQGHIDWYGWLFTLGGFWMLLFAAVIAWKARASADARVLCLWLILFQTVSLSSTNWWTPFAPLDCLLNFLALLGYVASLALVATLAALFARPPSISRCVLTWIAYAVSAASATIYVLYAAGIWFGVSGLLTPSTLRNGVAAVASLCALLCAALSLAASRGGERTRLAWIAGSLAVTVVPEMCLDLTGFLPRAFYQPIFDAANASSFITPVGLTYALLNRRLLDVGFALNRAAVYTAVSIVIVGFFVLAEWALSEWLRDASHTTNLAVSGVLALALGLSVRAVHARVDHFIDVVFFRKRHEDEHALRTFAHEAAYITDPDTLLQRTREVVQRHTGAVFADVVRCDALEQIDENDPALVALRAWRKPLALHDLTTALRGEIAFPMVARGRLVGALVLGAKGSQEAYAPDESAALDQVAHSVGLSLDVLDAKREGTADTLNDIRSLLQLLVNRETPA